MKKLELQKITESELSQIRGGEWVYMDGEWIWIEDQAIKPPFDLVRQIINAYDI